MQRTLGRAALVCAALVCAAVALLSPAAAGATTSSALNWTTKSDNLECGVTARVYGTQLDPGTGAQLNGQWPGLQCSAEGIPRPRQGVGDPFVQLGQGHAGRARLVDESQDDLESGAAPVELAPGSTWKRYGITCTVKSASIRCVNSSGHGSTLSTGHLHLF